MSWIIIGLGVVIALLIILIDLLYAILLEIKETIAFTQRSMILQNDKIVEILNEIKNDVESMKIRM